MYGPKLEQPVFDGLKAIADVRCGNGQCVGYWHAGKDGTNGVLGFDAALGRVIVRFRIGEVA